MIGISTKDANLRFFPLQLESTKMVKIFKNLDGSTQVSSVVWKKDRTIISIERQENFNVTSLKPFYTSGGS